MAYLGSSNARIYEGPTLRTTQGGGQRDTQATDIRSPLRETNYNDVRMSRRENFRETQREDMQMTRATDLRETRRPESGLSDYLNAFDYLNDYDDAGHFQEYSRQDKEDMKNPYGWYPADQTLRPPSRTEGLGHTGGLKRTRQIGFRTSVKSDLGRTMNDRYMDEDNEENPYGHRAIGRTRLPRLGRTGNDRVLDEDEEENPYGHKAIGRTRPPRLERTRNDKDSDEDEEEDPYGHKAIGRTRPPRVLEAKENPYGHKVIGQTRPPDYSEDNPYGQRAVTPPSRKSTSEATSDTRATLQIGEENNMNALPPHLRGKAPNYRLSIVKEADENYRQSQRYDYVDDVQMRPKRQSWKSLALDFKERNSWYALFNKMKKKWTVGYADADMRDRKNEKESSSASSSVSAEWLSQHRLKVILIILAVLTVLLVAVVVPLVVILGKSDGNTKFGQYELQIVVRNRNYTTDMKNSTSNDFVIFEEELCNQLLNVTRGYNYKYEDCIVSEIRNGSLLVDFLIYISTAVNKFPDRSELRKDLKLLPETNKNIIIVGSFEILAEDFNISRFKDITALPQATRYNGSCNATTRCETPYSACPNGRCECIQGRRYNDFKCLPITCSPDQAVSDGNVTIFGVQFGEKLEVECNPGFELVPANFTGLTCLENNNWGTLPACNRLNCSEPDLSDHLRIKTQDLSYLFESELELECVPGYNLVGLNTTTCQFNGNWTDLPFCEPISCPTFSPPDNTLSLINLNGSFGNNISIECSLGYNLNGNDTVQCLDSGKWSDSPKCELINCGNLTVPEYSNLIYSNGTTFNETVTVTCDYRYKVSGDSSFFCTGYGNWSGSPVCELKLCPSPNISENHVLEPQNHTFTVDSEFKVKCKEGFTPSIFVTVTCMENETWSMIPECEPVNCGFVMQVMNAESLSVSNTLFNASFEVNCVTGYKLEGNKTVTCQDTGNWSVYPNCTIVDCGDVVPPVHSKKVYITGLKYNNTAEFECDPGYYLLNHSFITCLDNGSWSEYPTCQIKDCGNISNPNFTVTYENQSTTFGSIAVINCTSDLDRIGSESVMCLSTGKWEQLPSCVQNSSCGAFDTPANARVYETNGNLSIECDANFTLNGRSNLVECQSDSWVYANCEPVCMLFDSSEIIKLSDNSTVHVAGAYVNVSCQDGYATNDSTMVTCLGDHTWTQLPECHRTHCFGRELPDNVNLTSNQLYNFSEHVYVSCLPGYKNDDDNQITCMSDGHWSNFSTCENVSCSLANFSELFDLNQTRYEYFVNESVSLKCAAGYTINGTNTVTCLESGLWSEEVKCEKVTCGNYTLPNNSRLADPSQTSYLSYEYRTTLDIMCERGFALVNSNESSLTCEANGDWEGRPECDIQGTISFAKTESHFTTGNNESISCTLANAPNWTNVVLLKNTTSVPVPLYLVHMENGQVRQESSNATGAELATHAQEKDGVTITLPFYPVLCSSEGDYVCATFVSEKTPNISTVLEELKRNDTVKGNFTRVIVNASESSCETITCSLANFPDYFSLTETMDTYDVNDSVSLECVSGFVINGSSNITCLSNGSWSENATCEKITCKNYTLPNNSMFANPSDLNNAPYDFNTTLEITCTQGYTLENNNESSVTCKGVDVWDGTPECVQEDTQYRQFSLQVMVTSENFSSDMLSPTSEAFVTFSEEFCKEMLNLSIGASNNYTYEKCFVTDIKNGSLIVQFRMVVSTTSNTFPDQNDTLADLKLTSVSNNNLTVGKFVIDAYVNVLGSSNVLSIEKAEPEVKEYNASCNVTTDRCVTLYSACVENRCRCIRTRWYNGTSCLPITCSQDPTVTDGIVTRSGVHYGDVLKVKCNSGFELIPANFTELTCFLNDYWGTLPVCKRVNCSVPELSDHLKITSKNVSYLFESELELGCESGYNMVGSNTTTCQADGSWTSFPFCQQISCPKFSPPDNTLPLTNLNGSFGDNITIKCSLGYNLHGNDTVKCLNSGSWSESPECEIINCGYLNVTEYTNLTYSNGTTFNETVTVSCDYQYKVSGDSSFFCTEYGNWSGSPICEQIFCSSPNISENHFLLPQNHTFSVDSEFKVKCKEGFTPSTYVTVTCLENETWSMIPECEPINCGSVMQVMNAEYINVSNTLFNDSFEVNCITGYKLEGNKTVFCQDNGNWSIYPNCTIVDCGDVVPPVHSKKVYVTGLKYNDTAEFECDPGYYLLNHSFITCLANGSWSEYPACQIKDCGNISQSDFTVTYINQSTSVGSTAVINCTGDLDRIGSESVVCLEIGEWEQLPSCVQNSSCGAFDPPSNARANGTKNNILIVCDADFILNGSTLVECKNGSWIHAYCEPACMLFDSPENIKLSDNSTVYVAGAKVSVSCKDGYATNDSNIITCVSNHTWTQLPECYRTHCFGSELPDKVNLTSQQLYNFSDIVYVSCLPGYKNDDDNQITCMTDGHWSNFSTCENVSCSLANFSELFDLNQIRYDYYVHESVSLKCAAGHTITGNNTVTCLESGLWSEDVKCENVTCGNYTLPNNSRLADPSQVGYILYEFGTTLDIKCKPGFTLKDSNKSSLTCEANGEWEGRPECDIQGTISWSKSEVVVSEGKAANLTCTLSDAPNWTTVILAKLDNTTENPTILLLLSNSDGNVSVDTNSSEFGTLTYEENVANVTVTLSFNTVSCNDTGRYMCATIGGESDNNAASIPNGIMTAGTGKGEFTSITVYAITLTTDVTVQNVSATCVGRVGFAAISDTADVDIMLDNSTKTGTLEVIAMSSMQSEDPSDSCYNITKNEVFIFSGTGSVYFKCLLHLSSGTVESETVLVSVTGG